MKRMRIIFMCTLLMLIMISGTVLAVSKDETGDVGVGSYRKYYTGTSSVCVMSGTSSEVYTGITNQSTSTRYLLSSTWEYKYNYGWQNTDSESRTVNAYVQLLTEVPRNLKMDGYYYHTAYCYENEYNRHLYDRYIYTARQIRN